jgi:TolB-like protein
MKGRAILESWKEIAVYLRRSVRTCRRWEQDFGLPIHRLGDAAQGPVYAETGELDAWMKEKLHLAEPGVKALPSFRSLAVLPIQNLTGEVEKAFYADGLTEVLITEMGQVGTIRVISHQSVKQFKDSRKPVQEIAKLLSVEALVEGALLQTRGKVRLSVNLISAFPERHLWAQLYECEPPESAGLPGRVAHAVMLQAGIALTPQVEARLSDRPAPKAEAFEAYLHGRASVRKSFMRADIELALSYFERAIAIDPGFAPAYAEKAWAFSQLGTYSHRPPKEAFPKQKEVAQRAIELDPGLADGYAALGYVSVAYDWEWQRADDLFRRALELNPNSRRTLFYYAQYLTWMRRVQDAIEVQGRLIGLDPLNPESHWNLGWTLFWAVRYDEAKSVFIGLMEHAPEDHWLEMALGMTYLYMGRPDEALRMGERARLGVPLGIDAQFDCFTAYILAATGKSEKAREILEYMTVLETDRPVDHTQVALIHLSLGENEAALGRFEKAYREKSPLMVFLNVAPFWKPLGGDPRFRSLFRRMGFPNPQMTA